MSRKAEGFAAYAASHCAQQPGVTTSGLRVGKFCWWSRQGALPVVWVECRRWGFRGVLLMRFSVIEGRVSAVLGSVLGGPA